MRIKKKTIMDVGIFVTAGLGLALMAVFLIGRERSLFERRYTLIAPFEDISGLRSGAVVQIAGLNAGYVNSVRFPADKTSQKLEVIMKVGKGYRDRIRKDSKASIHTQGLLGDKYIFITTGSAGFAPLENGEYIETEEIANIQNLTESGSKTLQAIENAAKEISDTLKKIKLDETDRANLKKAIANIETTSGDMKEISGKIRNGEGTLGALIMDPSLYNDMRALLGEANRNKLFKTLIRGTIEEQEKGTSMPVKK